MLERIREGSQGPWAMIIIGLVVLSFIFAGVGSYLTSSGSTAVATVNGQEISAQELERAYQNQRAQMESQYGEGVSALFADENYLQEFRRNVLNKLIGEVLVRQKAADLGLRVGDEQIKEAITSMPQFQYDGKFDNERFKAILRQNGYQPSAFRDLLRDQMSREQLTRALSATVFALPSEISRAYALQQQTRDARYVQIDAAPFAESLEITDAEVQAYYDANITAFDTDERVNIAYVMLSVEDMKRNVEVSDDEVRTYYDNNKNAYQTDEKRRVSHILIEAGDDESAAEEKAESLKAKLNDGADFAELAKAESDDTFSAENGGDLDFIAPDMMDPAFDEAAFGLAKVGDVSDVIKTDFGFHIIKLTDLKPQQVTPFDDVKADIREQLLTDKATEEFYALQTELAQVAFETPDTLEEVAALANQPVKETGMFDKNSAPEPLNNPSVVNIAFSPELVEDKVNSDVIELDSDSVIVMRAKAHEPQRTQPLEEVKEGIVAMLRAEKAQSAALEWAQNLNQKLDAGEDIAAQLEEKGVEWKTVEKVTRSGNSELPRELRTALFRLAPQQGKQREVATLASGNVGIVELVSVHEAGEMTGNESDSIAQALTNLMGQETYRNFVEGLRSEADITVNI